MDCERSGAAGRAQGRIEHAPGARGGACSGEPESRPPLAYFSPGAALEADMQHAREIVMLSMRNAECQHGRGAFAKGALDRIVTRVAGIEDKSAAIDELAKALDDEMTPFFRRREFRLIYRRGERYRLCSRS